MAKNTKRPRFTSPIGTLGFPCAIHAPDTKFADEKDPNDKGTYVARLVLPKESTEAQQFLATLEDHFKQGYDQACIEQGKKSLKMEGDAKPWQDELDRETEAPTGNIIFRFKLKARVTKKDGTFFDQRPKVFDTAAPPQLLTNPPPIGPGSRVRISGQVHTWFTSKFGMTLWLEAAQLHTLVEAGAGMTAEGYGFGSEEGGYTADAAFTGATAGEEGSGDF